MKAYFEPVVSIPKLYLHTHVYKILMYDKASVKPTNSCAEPVDIILVWDNMQKEIWIST